LRAQTANELRAVGQHHRPELALEQADRFGIVRGNLEVQHVGCDAALNVSAQARVADRKQRSRRRQAAQHDRDG
jgi:hypothetical protein